MLVYENSQVQGPDGIGNAAGKAEELEGVCQSVNNHPWKDI